MRRVGGLSRSRYVAVTTLVTQAGTPAGGGGEIKEPEEPAGAEGVFPTSNIGPILAKFGQTSNSCFPPLQIYWPILAKKVLWAPRIAQSPARCFGWPEKQTPFSP